MKFTTPEPCQQRLATSFLLRSSLRTPYASGWPFRLRELVQELERQR
jgi:hypothetical protein